MTSLCSELVNGLSRTPFVSGSLVASRSLIVSQSGLPIVSGSLVASRSLVVSGLLEISP